MKNLVRAFCTGSLVVLAAATTQAQPANNNFANAWTLTGTAVTTNGSNAGANKEDGEPNHDDNQGGRSVWFNWTAPASALTRFDTTNSAFRSLLAVYTGSAVNSLTEVAANQAGQGTTGTAVQFQAAAGTTYRIAVDARRGFGGTPNGGNYVLNLRVLASVAITAPADNSVLVTGTPIAITADATVPGATISRVDFYRDTALIGSDDTAPYETTLNGAPLGTNRLTAVAVDSASLSWPSAPVTILVLNPGVTITGPGDGATFLNASPITVSAVALLATGAMTNVEFFANGVSFGQDAASPFQATWNGVTPGTHRLTAIGRATTGLASTSAPVLIAVARLLVPSNSVWKYFDAGTDPGAQWKDGNQLTPPFDDSAWMGGPAPLGYGDSNGRQPLTTNSFGPDTNNKYPATYFRHSFLVTNVAGFTNLALRLERDDGAVVYLNGVELGRFNMPTTPLTFTTLAAANAQDDGTTVFTLNVPNSATTRLVEGTNVLAVEVHQDSVTSSDIWMVLELLGVPSIVRNQTPTVALTSPLQNESFRAPASVTVTATAADADGTVTNVALRVLDVDGNDTLLAHAAAPPYAAIWNAPAEGWYNVYAVATDDQGASATAAGSFVAIYDALGTPRIRLFNPTNGAVFAGPTNLALFAGTTSPNGVTNVQFFANGVALGQVAFPTVLEPVSANFTWTNATFGTNTLTAISFDDTGLRGTSAPVVIVVTAPPPNLSAPGIFSRTPAASAVIGALSTVQVVFTERVIGVNAADLFANGLPALSVTGSGSNYTFTVGPPGAGEVFISWEEDHGIVDVGFPPRLFDASAPGATWTYTLTDLTPPTVAAKIPAAGAIVTNLTQVNVTFSEPVTGVDAADLLVNGVAAIGLGGGGAAYTFNFSQPGSGPVNIMWAGGHGISDLALPPNAFNAASAGATWSYTLDDRTLLVQSNATWLFVKGNAEASTPSAAWRQPDFVDVGWSNAAAPFYFGDPYNSAANPGTLLSDMANGYTTIYLRRHFSLADASAVTNLLLTAQIDDGFIMWINGVEVLRVNAPGGDVPYNGVAPGTANEPNQAGAASLSYPLLQPPSYLVTGDNVIAVHGLNQSLTSSDFGFNAQLYTYLADPSLVAPRLASVNPPAGDVFFLTNLTVRFSEPVSGVDAGDLRVNNVPATSVTSTTNTTYRFGFAQPPFGPAVVTWTSGHSIADFDSPPKAFDGAAPGATFQFSVLNPSAPTIAAQAPLGAATINSLTQIVVTFSEPVTGVEAEDLLINGAPAADLSGGPARYTFAFAQPAFGPVSVGWGASHGITDLEDPRNPFDAARAVNSWAYTLVDQTPPAILARNPAAGALVTNLTQIGVTFSEPVGGVNAADLLINGTPATGLSGGPAAYTFTFPQPNAIVVNVAWAPAHGIRDLAPAPNAFDAAGPGATWSYTTPDNLPPAVAALDPPPFVTVRSLAQIRVTFTEPVFGVDTNDLLMNGVKARQIAGSGAGPYTFTFLPPAAGSVDLRWSLTNGITDLANPPNPFAGGEWTYTLDPTAYFAEKILVNEIMFNPPGGRPADEWIELRNVASTLINLTGWRFTRGVDYTFPNVTIPAGGYLVVAADPATFQANHPGVANVVGGWRGQLANSEETIELKTALGETVNSVHYATEGDWARRERGRGTQLAASVIRNGGTATVTAFNHGVVNNDIVIITGANQPEYNGRFAATGVTPGAFNIAVTGTPASPATGAIVIHHAVHNGSSGWGWSAAADGFGPSLELANPALGNAVGQNWLASTTLNGTPGQANSVATTNLAPLVSGVTHFPPVPRSANPVTVTARVRDELTNGVQTVQLLYRNHTTDAPGPFVSTNMFDDGNHGDGLNRDGLFGAVLPAAANGTIIEFYVRAADTTGQSRTWPAPTWETNNTFAQLANAVYQVDNETPTDAMQTVRLVMTGTEFAANNFPAPNRNSDAEANTTFISLDGDGTKVRYLCGVRVRGAGSRTRTPPNNRLNIPNDNTWNGLTAVNLNGQFVHAQIIGAAVAQLAGLPASDAHPIQYRINGVNPAPLNAPNNGSGNGAGYGTFAMLKPVNGDLAADLFPNDGEGNVYRASTGNHNADLTYRGVNPVDYLTRGYVKTANQTENDWTDLMNLTTAFSQVAGDPDYLQAIGTNVNVEMWMRYFAVGSLINFGETSLFNGRGDDYAMYRADLDRRFVLFGHDFDTIFGQGDTTTYYPVTTDASIFIMLNPPNPNPNVPTLRRFLTAFAPIFYSELKRLADTTFSPAQLDPLMDQLLTGWGNGPTTGTINQMKTHAASRRGSVLAQIPLALTITHSLGTSNGLPYTTTPAVTLAGAAHAIDTRKVLVNGAEAGWSAFDARWTQTVNLAPGINRVLVQSLDRHDVEFARVTLDLWYDRGGGPNVAGAIATDTFWTAANGPYQVTGNLTVNAGVTLTIQAGTTVYFNSGVDLVVANGGRLLAEGTDTARIRLAAAPGVATWGGLTVNGGATSPETRLAYTHIQGNNDTAVHAADGTVFLDHLTFGNPGRQYVSLDRASFVVQDCVFPAVTAGFEPVHGTGGIKTGGRGIVRRNFFGRIIGYNDALDFTGGNRPGPILQVINNVFMGSDDDLLDLDSTDAWVEGNIFLHTHRNGSPDSASAVSGGADNADTSQITIIGNLFYDVDHAANAKQGNFYTLLNNTIVHQTRVGSQDTNTAVVILADLNEQGVFTAQGAGMYLEGNIIFDADNLTRHVTTALVTFTNNLIHQLTGTPWAGPGGGNTGGDPLLKRIPPFSETTNFTSWAEAQVMWDYFSLRSGSPAIGSGPHGRDQGGVIPYGAAISGVPVGVTPQNFATLRVEPNRVGAGIPIAGFPNGSGFTHYRWRLDGGVWSAETPVATPIALANLASGAHFVEVNGRNDAGVYQNDPIFGPDAAVTLSRTWTVNPAASPLRLNEILASNAGAVNHFGTTPDLIELHNASDATVDLAGVRLTTDRSNPDRFIFPAGASLGPRSNLVVIANNPDATPGYHLGFNLGQGGEAVYLYASADNGGAVIDSVTFGPQLPDLSVGRLADGSWTLTVPTFGAANRAASVGDPRALRINEWLAIAQAPFNQDFVELYNSDALPVGLGGLFISDEILGWRDRHQFPALSFVAGNGYLRLVADGDISQGPDHLSFALNGDQGALGLYLPDLTAINVVVYNPQRANVSQGRSPNGGVNLVSFDTPTPGAPNPFYTGPAPNGGILVINEVLAANAGLAEADGRKPDWVELYNGTTTNVILADLSLTDDTLQPRRFVFGPGLQLAPGGYLRVICDPNAAGAGSLLNTNFALKAAGGGVFLFDRLSNGGSLLNAITYGLQTSDLSIGRVPDGSTNWMLTAPTPNGANSAIATLGDVANLKVNEWMADAGLNKDDWFEIYNPNPLPVALGGLFLTDDLNNRTKHPIAALSFLGTGTNAFQRFLATGTAGADADRVNFSLRALGEAVGLSGANGALLDGSVFGPQVEGVSEGRFPDGSPSIVAFPGTASPGESNYRLLTEVAINEVLTHTDEPLEDAIELRNLTGQPLDVGGWWLSDDNSALQKYQIPSPTMLPAHGFAVIYETSFTNRELAALPFALSSHGDEVVLSPPASHPRTGYRTSVKFGAADNGVSFGRHPTSDNRAEFVAMSARSFGVDDPGNVGEFRTGTGQANALPRVGPVVISEIMYHPPEVGPDDNVADEFIELHNITTAPVPLYDPAAATNVWRLRDAVDFDFPTGTVMAPGGNLLVVSFDPVNNPAALAAFRSRYNVALATAIVGPYVGKLANDNDEIELRKPGVPDLAGVDSILVERVKYFDTAPWPPLADGIGYSLQRISDASFGNDPLNWTAALPTPGPGSSSFDSDGDGLPDSWEIAHGFDPFNPLDAVLDTDGDGLTNLQEFQLGTDPRDPESGGVRFTSIALAVDGMNVVLTFTAYAGQTYSVEATDALGSGVWTGISDIAAAPATRVIRLAVPGTGTSRFYRLRTPWRLDQPGALRINRIQASPDGQVTVTFEAPANVPGTLLYTPQLGTAPWTTVETYLAAPTNRVIQVVTPASGRSGFYRLRAP